MMTKHRDKLLLGAALLMAATATAAIAGPDRDRGGMMGRADANDDGVVTVEEVRARREQRFRAADGDGDGTLDVEEMRNLMLQQRARRHVQWLDRDGDSAVSADEFAAPMERRLKKMDRNGDGRLERAEMSRGGHERREHDERMSGHEDYDDD